MLKHLLWRKTKRRVFLKKKTLQRLGEYKQNENYFAILEYKEPRHRKVLKGK